jgi:hypothetical protein
MEASSMASRSLKIQAFTFAWPIRIDRLNIGSSSIGGLFYKTRQQLKQADNLI